jgi:hypothetical protein
VFLKSAVYKKFLRGGFWGPPPPPHGLGWVALEQGLVVSYCVTVTQLRLPGSTLTVDHLNKYTNVVEFCQ